MLLHVICIGTGAVRNHKNAGARRTRTLTLEQVDRYITEYEGGVDMQFVNGPMQQDQENTAGDDLLEDSY